ncbi:MAG: SAF domain-containing protein [Nocardioidaceae bacterium]
MTITNQSTGKKAKGTVGSGANKLPSARERRPALAALAVLLIAGGAVLAGWLALREGHTTSYLVITDSVHAGEQISHRDLGEVELNTGTGLHLVAASDASTIVGSYALTDIAKGTPLTTKMAGDHPALPSGTSRIGLSLDPGQRPDGLHVGSDVRLAVLPPNGQSDTPLGNATAVVRSIKSGGSSGQTNVDVLVPVECMNRLTGAASNGDVSLGIMPPTHAKLKCTSSILDK